MAEFEDLLASALVERDPDAREAVTNALLEAGDARGDAFVLEARIGAAKGATRAEAEQLLSLYRTHLASWLPKRYAHLGIANAELWLDTTAPLVVLQAAGNPVRFDGGFVCDLTTMMHDNVAVSLEDALDHFRYLRALSVWDSPYRIAPAFHHICAKHRSMLRTLEISAIGGARSNWEVSAKQTEGLSNATPNLQSLSIKGRRVAESLHHENVSELAMVGYHAFGVPDVAGRPFPRLRRFDLGFAKFVSDQDADEIAASLAAPAFQCDELTLSRNEGSFSQRAGEISAYELLPSLSDRRLSQLSLPSVQSAQDVSRLEEYLQDGSARCVVVARAYRDSPSLEILRERFPALQVARQVPWMPGHTISSHAELSWELHDGSCGGDNLRLRALVEDIDGLEGSYRHMETWQQFWNLIDGAENHYEAQVEFPVRDLYLALAACEPLEDSRMLSRSLGEHLDCCPIVRLRRCDP